jgi:hypothetical protein
MIYNVLEIIFNLYRIPELVIMRVRMHQILIIKCLIARIGLLVNILIFDLFRAVDGLRLLTIDQLLFHHMCHIMVSIRGVSCASLVLLYPVFLLIGH